MSYRKKIGLLTLLLVVLTVLFLGIGLNSNNWSYALSRRIPRIAAILLTGSVIAFSTMVFQTITNNRILTPSVLGLDALYIFIQTLIVFIFAGRSLTLVSRHTNFLLSVLLMIIFSSILYKFLFKKEQQNIYFLLLIGLIFSTLFQSLSSFMQMLIDPNEFGIVQSRMFASFNNVNTDLLYIAIGIILCAGVYTYPYIKIMDVLSLGREEAINLGIDYDKSVKRMLIVVVIMVSVATALVGPITFLGLLVVNLARELLHTYQHKYLITTSILISGIALVGGQLMVERVLNFKTPLSVIINLVGGLYFIYLLLKEGKE
ncbi:ABC-type enterochelin transport system, permease component [Clostridium aceticum]|uniref:ABC-type enterochelin transport system, permease component n=1 Tax=Clostridium aceticum TaxID=84022 RepID=A0A0D8II59_9CLOT|nr:iron chelate uptake ABC transporter family permease subunit [Clostridium aceticum]AKL95354.1 ABC-type enterochelin transport system, permease component [Clostridium aceticum]KJF28836.1 iron ABC transporter permease [Clostridium aceticum]